MHVIQESAFLLVFKHYTFRTPSTKFASIEAQRRRMLDCHLVRDVKVNQHIESVQSGVGRLSLREII